MDITSFLMGIGTTILLGVIAIAIAHFRETYILIERDEYDAIMNESLRNVANVRRLEAEVHRIANIVKYG